MEQKKEEWKELLEEAVLEDEPKKEIQEAQVDAVSEPVEAERPRQEIIEPEPDDYVVATGETHSVKELLELAFGHIGLEWKKHVEIDPKFYRPAEVDQLVGDATKAHKKLGWMPKTKFADLVRLMVDADVQLLENPSAGAGRNIG